MEREKEIKRKIESTSAQIASKFVIKKIPGVHGIYKFVGNLFRFETIAEVFRRPPRIHES